MKELYKEWCKETNRNGGVLVHGSIYEFFDWLEQKNYEVIVNRYPLISADFSAFDDKAIAYSEQAVTESLFGKFSEQEEPEYCPKDKWGDCECVDYCKRGLLMDK